MIYLYLIIGFMIIILLVFIVDFIYRYYYLKKFWHSYIWVLQELDYLASISGGIRKGKTTLMFGISQLLTLKIKEDLKQKMNEIETILIEINFSKLQKKISKLLMNNYEYELIENEILIEFISIEKNILTHKLNNLFFDYLKYEEKISLLKKYVYYFYHFNRSDHLYSNVLAWNQITKLYGKHFDIKWIQLKNERKLEEGKRFKDFPLDEYSIFMYDEQLLESSNNHAVKRLNEDSGSDIFYRLFGQIFRESSYYITTLQNVKRWFKSEREIIQQHIYVNNSSLILTSPLKLRIINLLEKLNNFIYKFRKDELYRNKENIFKRNNLRFLKYKKKLISNGFIKFNTTIYSDLDLVGKHIDEEKETKHAYNFDFILPVSYCWEIGNTHLFHFILIYLKNHSKISRNNLDISKLDDEIVEEMFEKYKNKTNTEDIDIEF